MEPVFTSLEKARTACLGNPEVYTGISQQKFERDKRGATTPSPRITYPRNSEQAMQPMSKLTMPTGKKI